MPKIIEDLDKKLIAETRRQIEERGYSETTIRSVASACGVGVGTVYNYFASKDMLIATFMLSDWNAAIEEMKTKGAENNAPHCILKTISDTLVGFKRKYEKLFSDQEAIKVFGTVFAERHPLLRRQLSALVLPVCAEIDIDKREFTAEFIAEALLTWMMSGKSYDELSPIFEKILK